MEIEKIGQINEIHIYFDPTMKEGSCSVCYKPKQEGVQGLIFLPTENLEKEYEKPLRIIEEFRTYENIQYILGSSKDLEFYKELIKRIQI